ncbi:CLUMA_CG004941, isoform A [Clunio marinus]|uniref:Cytochrome c oxidase copper chaperone n=1 Tax=Clunio marinus TaxID=568069 RepID=A0A1J1HTE1_9DIPT|nr:CLUMA_CG004941, isoform A [Clunio marinus]
MGNTASTMTPAVESINPPSEVKQAAPEEKKKCKACCACPETKKIRDECIMEKGEENCGDLIEKHKQCMRDLGFKI